VCTLTRAEGQDVVAQVLDQAGGGAASLEPPGPPWQPAPGADGGATAILLPIDNDGMTLARFRKQ
jgi:16S rRNA C967 or C1407 C5-methylase (RsmB/RsmF family)